MKIILPDKVNQIIDTLMRAGYEAFAVGGCIRDSILGRNPEDWDITTSASPIQVKALFHRTVDTGIQHGTVTVMLGKDDFEVTTYRIDGEYENFRHPKNVIFTTNLIEDLKRRDFTINAMAYNHTTGLVDVFHGMEDLQKGMIRCVGNAKERFEEDALRMLRAIRFSAQLGYEIEKETEEAIRSQAKDLSKISAERVRTELLKLILSDHPEKLIKAYETGVTSVVFPEFDQIMETPQNNVHHRYPVGEHTICAMRQTKADKILRLTMLFHDIGKPRCRTTDQMGIDHFYNHASVGYAITREVMKRLRFDNETLGIVSRLVAKHAIKIEDSQVGVRRAIYEVGEDIFPYLLMVKWADAQAKSDESKAEKIKTLQSIELYYKQIQEKEECISLKMLAVTGADLIKLGIKPGKEIGEILQKLLLIVIENPDCNQKELLLRLIEQGDIN